MCIFVPVIIATDYTYMMILVRVVIFNSAIRILSVRRQLRA